MMTIETMTWRTFLDDYCRRLKPDEKQAFAAHVGVSTTTINRWRRGKDSPKAINLERILSAFSESQRQQFLVLLRRDPKVWSLLPADIQNTYPLALQPGEQDEHTSHFRLGLLDHFCLKILRLQRDTPDRFWQISGAVLREALKQLETHPTQTGLEIIITKCMPPKDGKVRSLRATVGMGTPPWRGDLHYIDGFLGIKSLAGYAVARRHGEMIPAMSNAHMSAQVMGQEQSAAAFPIMRENCIAGALLVLCAQADYFTAEKMELIEIFADLIRLAFYDSEDEFHSQETIDLGLMPSWAVQREHFESFRKRVEDEYRRASTEESSSMRELMRIEERVREQIEDELLKIEGSEESVVI